jgi:hypothetical protein
MAVVSALFGNIEQSWPVLLILAGAYLLYTPLHARNA